MESFLALLIKLTVIFLGGGLVSLFVVWIGEEISKVANLIIHSEIAKEQEKKLRLSNCEKVSSLSGLYEISIQGDKALKLFSSHIGMRIFN